MNEIKLKSDLNVVRTYLEKKKVSQKWAYHGKGLFHTHINKVEPKEFGKTLDEKMLNYIKLREMFENVTGALPQSDPFFLSYGNEAEFYFNRLNKKLGLIK